MHGPQLIAAVAPRAPFPLFPFLTVPVSLLQSAMLTACGEESVTLPTSSESSEEEEEKLDLSSVRRCGWAPALDGVLVHTLFPPQMLGVTGPLCVPQADR